MCSHNYSVGCYSSIMTGVFDLGLLVCVCVWGGGGGGMGVFWDRIFEFLGG